MHLVVKGTKTVEKTWDEYVDSGHCDNCGLLADIMGGVGAEEGILKGFGAKPFVDRNGREHLVCCSCHILLQRKEILSVRLCHQHHALYLRMKADLAEFLQTPLQEIATMERSRVLKLPQPASCHDVAETMRTGAAHILGELPGREHLSPVSQIQATHHRTVQERDGKVQVSFS